MPRNRIIKPEFWDDEKLGQESESVQLTFAGLWTFSDDYGVVRANPTWLKNQIYPYKDKLRLDAFSAWLNRLSELEAIILFTYRGENFYCIRTFRRHQYIEKPSKTRNCPEEELLRLMEEKGYSLSQDREFVKVKESRGIVGECSPPKEKITGTGNRTEIGSEEESPPDGVGGADAPPPDPPILYQALAKDKKSITDFIRQHHPDFIDPYVDLWNLFAREKGRPKVKTLTDERRRKFRVRFNEKAFDFPAILRKAKDSKFLLTGSWFCFDWIIESEKNYVKILEGNYDNDPEKGDKPSSRSMWEQDMERHNKKAPALER